MKDKNRITITRDGVGCRVRLSSKCDIFQNETLIVSTYDEYMLLKVPTLDYRGRTHKLASMPNSEVWKGFSITDQRIQTGVFEFDEDSTEDEVIIYFN